MERLRVLQVVPYFPPDRIGGVGEVAAHLHRGLLNAGHDSLVLTAGTTRNDSRVIRIASSPVGFVLKCSRPIELVRGRDIVHCHTSDALGLVAAMRLRRVRVPVLVTFHSSSTGMGRAVRPYRLAGRTFGAGWRDWTYRNLTSTVHRLFDRIALRLSNGVSFVSRSAARDVLGAARAESAHVVHNAAPDLPEQSGHPPVEPAELLFVGLPRDSKRVNALPFVLRRIREVIRRARLRLVGFRLEDYAELENLFDELKVRDGVVSEGQVRSDEIHPFYLASRVLLVPSAYEGLPMVVLEALGAGLPCVASRVGGLPEIIDDGVNGFLTDLDRPEDMADRCIEILKDAELQRKMGEAGRTLIVERFSLSRQLAEYEQLYRSLCSTRS